MFSQLLTHLYCIEVRRFDTIPASCQKSRIVLDSDFGRTKRLYNRPVHKNLFLEFPKKQAVLYYILIDKQMLH